MHAIENTLALLSLAGVISCGQRRDAVPEFTDEAQATFFAARDHAVRLKHAYLDAAHLLLALTDDSDNPAGAYLKGFAIDRGRLEDLAALAGAGAKQSSDMPYTAHALAAATGTSKGTSQPGGAAGGVHP